MNLKHEKHVYHYSNTQFEILQIRFPIAAQHKQSKHENTFTNAATLLSEKETNRTTEEKIKLGSLNSTFSQTSHLSPYDRLLLTINFKIRRQSDPHLVYTPNAAIITRMPPWKQQ